MRIPLLSGVNFPNGPLSFYARLALLGCIVINLDRGCEHSWLR
jgi:hypothetical protein